MLQEEYDLDCTEGTPSDGLYAGESYITKLNNHVTTNNF